MARLHIGLIFIVIVSFLLSKKAIGQFYPLEIRGEKNLKIFEFDAKIIGQCYYLSKDTINSLGLTDIQKERAQSLYIKSLNPDIFKSYICSIDSMPIVLKYRFTIPPGYTNYEDLSIRYTCNTFPDRVEISDIYHEYYKGTRIQNHRIIIPDLPSDIISRLPDKINILFEKIGYLPFVATAERTRNEAVYRISGEIELKEECFNLNIEQYLPSIRFKWELIPCNALDYELQIAEDDAFQNIIRKESTKNENYEIEFSDFIKNVSYSVRVLAYDEHGNLFNTSETSEFVLQPLVISLEELRDTAIILNYKNELRWTTNFFSEDTFNIFLSVDEKNDYELASKVVGIIPDNNKDSLFTYSIPFTDIQHALHENGLHKWKVSTNVGVEHVESEASAFWINNKNDPPNSFGLISGDVDIYNKTITLSWHNEKDPDPPDFEIGYYVYYIEKDSITIQSGRIDPQNSQDIKHTINENDSKDLFEAGGRFAWHVVAFDKDNNNLQTLSIKKLPFSIPRTSNPFELQLYYVNWDESIAFSKSIDSDDNFEPYAEFRITLGEKKLFANRLFYNPYLSALIPSGFKLGLSSTYRLMLPPYSLAGICESSYSQFDVGLRNRSRDFWRASIGTRASYEYDKLSLSLSLAWIPLYNVQYFNYRTDAIEAFNNDWAKLGDNIQIGFTIYIEPISLEYEFMQVVNDYGYKLTESSLGIGYRF